MMPEVRERYDQLRNGKIPQGYKQTALGIVPQEWEEFSLGEVYSERKQAGDPSLPVLSVSIHTGVSEGELDEETLGKKVKRIEDKTQYRTALEGDLVFNMMRAWQGAIGVVRNRGLVSPAYIVAKPGDQVYPPFMDYYMQTPRMINLIQRMSYGVTDFRLRLYWDSFEQIPCVLPPLHEQKRIVEILRAQDTIIHLGQQRIEQIKRMKKALLKKMIPQKESFLPEIRFSGFTAPWEQRKFEEIAQRASAIGSASELPRVEYEDIISGTGRLNKDVSSKANSKSGIEFHAGDVLYGKLRPYLQNWLLPTFSGLAVGDFWVLQPQNADSGFLYRLIQSRQFDEVANQSTGTKMPRADWKLVSKTEFSVPKSIDEQAKIGLFFNGLDNLITLHQRALETEQKKKKALMQLLLTGLVRVKV